MRGTDVDRLAAVLDRLASIVLNGLARIIVDRLAGLNRELLEAENERKSAEAAYRATLAPGALEAQAETANNSSAATEAKLAELKQKRAQMLLEYTEKYPEVRDLDQQIAMLEKQSQQLRTHTESVVKTNLETRTSSLNMEDYIFQIEVPTEEVIQITNENVEAAAATLAVASSRAAR